MSLTKSATRRVALFTSSSLVAAGVAAAASLGAAVLPTAAFAQAVCSETQAQVSDSAADTVTCPVGVYPTGIQYTSNGDLTVNAAGSNPAGSPTTSSYGTGGIVGTAGAAADDITLRLTGTTTSSSVSFNSPFPALLNAQSQSGDVVVEVDIDRTNDNDVSTISANNAATTRLVRAVSTAGGDVTVRNLSTGNTGESTNAQLQATGNNGAVAVEARSVGGGDVTVHLGALGAAQGRLYGILAEADGAGAVSITGSGQSNSGVAGSAGLRVVAGSGAVTITGNQAQSGAAFFTGQTGVHIDSDGDVTFTGGAQGSNYGIDIVNVAAGTTTTLNLRTPQGDVGTTGGLAAIRASGAGDLLVNIQGRQRDLRFDFAGMSAPVMVAVNGGGAWRPTPNAATTVAGANFDLTIESDGVLLGGYQQGNRGSGNNILEAPTILTFTDPDFALINKGWIVAGAGNPSTGAIDQGQEIELRFVGLKEFRHSGSITLGSPNLFNDRRFEGRLTIAETAVNQTDLWYDDMFTFQDGHWIGEGGIVMMDVDTEGTQSDCTRAPVTNDFEAADCVRIVNSTVEGVTYVNLQQLIAGDRGRLTQEQMDVGILLIETPGSTVTAENFALDPSMRGFNPATGTLDKGLFQFALLFDAEDEEFRLFSTLTGAAYQLPMAATAAHNMWRTTTGSWLNRQADLRGSLPDGLGGGVWLRASGEQTDREIVTTATLGGLPFTTNNTHRQDTYAINGGVDIFSGSDGHTGYVVGLTGGYAHSDVAYEGTPNTQAMDAWTGGVYGGLVVGQLFVDAVVNANNVIIDTDAPGFGLLPEGTLLSSRMISLGGQVEAGWRMLFDGGFFVEPLASVSYVRSKIDDLEILPNDPVRPGLVVSYEDPSSFRAGVGGRFGFDGEFAGMRTQVSILGRTWQDLEGQNTASIHNLAFPDDPEIRVVDEFSDQFHEVAVGASIWSPNDIVSGFINLGGKFGDDYEAKTGSVGVRVAW